MPEDPAVTQDNLAKALAAFQRTLVSPETRFDRWVKGDDGALEPEELAGFSLFVGKAGCVAFHQGWRFTYEAFHDIGLPSAHKGRGPILGVRAADHAFKTPSLRERVWSAPYMHDGSLATLDAVLDHYDHGVIRRASLSPDLKRVVLTDPERAALLAFLASLSSENAPVPAPLVAAGPAASSVAREGLSSFTAVGRRIMAWCAR